MNIVPVSFQRMKNQSNLGIAILKDQMSASFQHIELIKWDKTIYRYNKIRKGRKYST